jgi:hypothetical protein
MIRSLLAFSFIFACAHAQAQSAQGGVAGKSAKKMAADHNRLSSPQVIEAGDNTIGLRAYQGDAFSNAPMLGVNYEHMINENFGVGGGYGYANYTNTVHVGGLKGQYRYDAHVYTVTGSYHFDLFKARNLDTYISAGVGRTVLKHKWHSNTGLADRGSAKGNSTYLLGYANFRYFVNSKFAFTGSLGAPVGTLALGADFLF